MESSKKFKIPWIHGNNRSYSCLGEEPVLFTSSDGNYTILEARHPNLEQYVGLKVNFEERETTKIIRKILKFTDELFTNHNIKYWINSGTLLGCARSGDVISWDNDGDILIPIHELTKVCSLKYIIDEAGFIYAENAKFGSGYKVYIKSKESPKIMTEISIMYPERVTLNDEEKIAWTYH
ncbi:MAG: hypothetical protein ACI934_000360, partial [Pseudohongiellaceae bacterium]